MLRTFLSVGVLGMAAALVGCEEDFNDRHDRLKPLPADSMRDDLRHNDLRREELHEELREEQLRREEELRGDELRGDLPRRDEGGVHVRWPGGGVDVKPHARDLDSDLDRREIDVRGRNIDVDVDRLDEREPRRIRLPNLDVDVRNQ